jgi:hypothetical protein
MTEKCCGTCGRESDQCMSYCTRSPYLNIAEECRGVNPIYSKLHNGVVVADFWEEGNSIENIMYRIKELEKKMGGI